MGEYEKERAKFEWPTFWDSIWVSVLDLVGVMGVVALIWCFIYYGVFDGECIRMSSKDIATTTRAVAWPATVALLILLFRNPLLRILNEVPSFIKRSYYRQGGNVLDANSESQKLDNENDGIASKIQPHERRIFDSIVGALVRRFGGTYYFEKCIGNRMYIFDIVIETKEKIYGVEVKRSGEVKKWEEVFHRVQSMCSSYDEALRSRFVFVAVVIGKMDDNNELQLRRKCQSQPFCTHLEIIQEEL